MSDQSNVVQLLQGLSEEILGQPADHNVFRFALSLLASYPAARFSGKEPTTELLELATRAADKHGQHTSQLTAIRRRVQSSRTFQKSAR